MYEIGDFIRAQHAGSKHGLGLHVQIGTRHLNGRDTGEPLAWFVGSVPPELAYEPGYTEDDVRKAINFGGRYGPKKRYWQSVEAAWHDAERLGYQRCHCQGCTIDAAIA